MTLSNRQRSGIFLAVAEALGHNLDEISTSKTTASRSGYKFNSQTFYFTIYLSNLRYNQIAEVDGKIEHLAIVVTGNPSALEGKLLYVSRIPDTTNRS